MTKILLLIFLVSISSCVNQKEIDAKAKHQAETGDRLNKSSKDTSSLFEEMK